MTSKYGSLGTGLEYSDSEGDTNQTAEKRQFSLPACSKTTPSPRDDCGPWAPLFDKFGGAGFVPGRNEFHDRFSAEQGEQPRRGIRVCIVVVLCLAVASGTFIYSKMQKLVLHHDDSKIGDGVAESDDSFEPFRSANRREFGENEGIWEILDENLLSDDLLVVSKGMKKLAKPFPTGAFWTNLVVKRKEARTLADAIAAMPYAFKWGPDAGIQVSYPAYRRSVQRKVIQDYFYPDITICIVGGISSRKIQGYDSLSVKLRLYGSSSTTSWLESFVVLGAPYITAAFSNAKPQLTALSTFASMGCMSDSAAEMGLCTKSEGSDGQEISGVQFRLQQREGQQWILFASEPLAFTLDASRRQLQAKKAYTGVLRLALIPPDCSLTGPLVRRLIHHSDVYPVGGKVDTEYYESSSGDEGSVRFVFDSIGSSNTKLLMLALPHHIQVLDRSKSEILPYKSFDGTYSCIKGNMTAVIGNSWSALYPLTSLNFSTDREIASKNMVKVIKKHLAEDVTLVIPTATDVYGFGKQIARMAQLAFIANVLKDGQSYEKSVDTLRTYLKAFLARDRNDHLVYDADLGGVVSSDGIKNKDADFGNGRYNDHHFHYGYIIYAAAILGKLDSTFVEAYGGHVDALVADIANDDPDNSFFPVARHKSWFGGHSWASGLFPQGNGKSQESSSEAVNSYYGVYLWSIVRNNNRLKNFARLLLAMEIRSVKTYWHMGPNSTVYDPQFSQNMMVGNLGGLDVTSKTWFGDKDVYVHLINFMPITPITEELFEVKYVESQYPSIEHMYDETEMAWRGYLVCNHAIIDPESAWSEAVSLKSYRLDPGLSLSQVIYWIGTRPSDLPQYNVTEGPGAECRENERCSGLIGNCCPTDDGVYLGCCD